MTADFAGGSISSDGGLILLRAAERRFGLAEALAGCIREWRDPERVVHTLPAMLRFRMFAIACGYEDADDCDALRADPLFKLAVGRAPESGRDLRSQPTMSRLENAPSRSEVARMTAAQVDLFCRSFPAPPGTIMLDIDDTRDAVHGHHFAFRWRPTALRVMLPCTKTTRCPEFIISLAVSIVGQEASLPLDIGVPSNFDQIRDTTDDRVERRMKTHMFTMNCSTRCVSPYRRPRHNASASVLAIVETL